MEIERKLWIKLVRIFPELSKDELRKIVFDEYARLTGEMCLYSKLRQFMVVEQSINEETLLTLDNEFESKRLRIQIKVEYYGDPNPSMLKLDELNKP